jgi:ABC-2 type transport system permease protein
MRISRRRVSAIVRKELREYRRHGSVLVATAIFPVIFLVQPLVVVFMVPSATAATLEQWHLLLYMLGIPVLTPAILTAYAVAGERQQGSLEPVLTTPIRREEFLLAKALAALIPSVVIAYGVYVIFLACVVLFAQPNVAAAVLVPDVVAQLLPTPLGRLVDLGRHRDLDPIERCTRRAAAQPPRGPPGAPRDLAHRLQRDPPDSCLAVGPWRAVLTDTLGWRVVSPMFDRERLITGTG